jgi:hypothetical protein
MFDFEYPYAPCTNPQEKKIEAYFQELHDLAKNYLKKKEHNSI